MPQTKAAKRISDLEKKGKKEVTTYTKLGPVTSVVKDPNYKKPPKRSGTAKKVSSVPRPKGMY